MLGIGSIVALAVLFWFKNRKIEISDLVRDVSAGKYNVLLITIDTLRSDRLGCYGFTGIQTPNIDSLAASGIRFVDATAHVPLTLPSHSSIHTGRFPSLHGVHDNGGFYLSKDVTTMAELFKNNGFATAAFVAAYVLDSSWGLNQGFDTYFDNFDLSKQERVSLSSVERKAGDVHDQAVRWLDQHRQERFFLWTHFYDPHTPYEPPEEFDRMYPNRPYVAEIAYTDSVIGRLLKYLDKHQLREKTIILLTADHGESLGEHAESTHAFYVYDATLKVPMILVFPDRKFEGRNVQDQARSIDIFPTLLQLSGIPVPENVQGRSLLHMLLGSHAQQKSLPSYAETYYPQYHFGWSRLLSLRAGGYKYIDAPQPELYDLKTDPGETRNVYTDHKSVAAGLKTELRKIEEVKAKDATMQPGAVDDETHEKLAALGYVGAFAGPRDTDPLKLPDPKTKIELFNLISSARSDSLAGEGASAIEKFEKALKSDPAIVDAQFMLGNEYFRQQKYEEALAAFRKTLELKPDYGFAMINLANTYRKMGKLQEAIAGFEYFLKNNPDHMQILFQLGEIYLAQNEPDKALDYLNRALNVEKETSWVYNSIGVAYIQKKEPQKAEEFFRTALKLNSKINMAHFNLAQLHESRENLAEAEKEYLEELEIAPENFKAHFNLGRMYVNQRRFTEGIRHLQAAVQEAPQFAIGYLFLAQAYLESGDNLDKAIEMANKGLSLDPGPEYKPLGHLVLADIYNRLGRKDLERQHLNLARGRSSGHGDTETQR